MTSKCKKKQPPAFTVCSHCYKIEEEISQR